MKVQKSYSARIGGNINKLHYLESTLSSKVSNTENVKYVEILRKKNRLYVKLTLVTEVPEPAGLSNPVGLDINSKRLALLNNVFYKMNMMHHRKMEQHKNKRNINNFTKDYVHKLTTKIVKDLSAEGTEILVLENLTGLRKSASRKRGTFKLVERCV